MNLPYLLILIFISCTHQVEKKSPDLSVKTFQQKAWINEPQNSCPASYLCFSKEGTNCNASDAEVKKEAIGFFRTKVEGKTQYHIDSHNDLNYEEIVEEANMAVNLTVNDELIGFEILERFKGENSCFTHGGFDKTKVSEVFIQEIEKLDTELETIQRKNQRSSIPKLLFLLEKRQLLAKYNLLIDGKNPNEKVTLVTILKIKDTKKLNNNVHMINSSSVPETLKKFFENEIGQAGFVITSKPNFSYQIETQFKAIEQYLNISGFKKYNFIFEAVSSDNFNNKLGKFVIQKIASGRNQSDAYFKIKNELEAEIKNQLLSLNMK